MKSIKISPPEGYEIDKDKSTLQEIVFKKIEKKLITSWEELEVISGRVISKNKLLIVNNIFTKLEAKSIYPTKEQAEAGLLLPQLLQVRDYLRDGWKPNENSRWLICPDIKKECVTVIHTEHTGWPTFSFSFPTKKVADHFAIHFGEDIIKFYTNLQ